MPSPGNVESYFPPGGSRLWDLPILWFYGGQTHCLG
jgi:hypothetical protein